MSLVSLEKGRQHLKSLKVQVQLVSRIGKEPWDAMTQKADQIYQLGHPSITGPKFGRVPLKSNQTKSTERWTFFCFRINR